ncbi:MAG: phosphoglucomutase/phosphomannomutase family protein, partial [Vulcanisaeta sp.]
KEYGSTFYRRIDLQFSGGKEFVRKNERELMEKLRDLGIIKRVITIDGIKVIFDDNSWILIRGSGTEPVIRIYAEAGSRDRLERIINNAVSIINSLR